MVHMYIKRTKGKEYNTSSEPTVIVSHKKIISPPKKSTNVKKRKRNKIRIKKS
jgi:hypothetical protein